MKQMAAILLTSIALLSSAPPSRAEPRIWSEWQTHHLGGMEPDRPGSVLVYFHSESATAAEGPIAMPVLEIARLAQWSILRINRREEGEPGAQDADILLFALNEISRLRREGYVRVLAAGVGRGGELAISVAAAGSVEAVLALAPGELGRADRDLLERQPGAALEVLQRRRDDIAGSLAKSKARRTAVVLFDDWWNTVPGGRAPAFRSALWQTGEAFLVVDRPADLPSDPYDGVGRFVRRYRDCLAHFLSAPETPHREGSCDLSQGYAVGSDIGFTSGRRRIQLPAFSHRSLAAFLGRWRGDDLAGSYMILESIEAGASSAAFRIGYSHGPWWPMEPGWQQEGHFRLTDEGDKLVQRSRNGRISLRSIARNELECVMSFPSLGPDRTFNLKAVE